MLKGHSYSRPPQAEKRPTLLEGDPLTGKTAPRGRAKIQLWTDGSLKEIELIRKRKVRSAWLGGWAFILKWGPHELVKYNGVYSEGERRGLDSDRMELTAIVRGLGQIEGRHDVAVYTDSQYAITVGRKAQERVNTGEHPVGGRLPNNWDLIQALCHFLKKHRVEWVYVKSHSGVEMNERADRLAKAGAEMAEHKFLVYAPLERLVPWNYEEPISLG